MSSEHVYSIIIITLPMSSSLLKFCNSHIHSVTSSFHRKQYHFYGVIINTSTGSSSHYPQCCYGQVPNVAISSTKSSSTCPQCRHYLIHSVVIVTCTKLSPPLSETHHYDAWLLRFISARKGKQLNKVSETSTFVCHKFEVFSL